MRQRPGMLPASVAALVELPPGPGPGALVRTGERVRAWHQDFGARLAAARGGRVDPAGIWASAPRPSPVMTWTPEQTAVFLRAAGRHRLHGLWRLIAVRGLRRGEGCGLRRSDTDLSVALTTVRWQITQLGWKTVQGAPKSGADDRTVAPDVGTVADIRRHRREHIGSPPEGRLITGRDAASPPGTGPARRAARAMRQRAALYLPLTTTGRRIRWFRTRRVVGRSLPGRNHAQH